jgi:hypothetical protein
VGDPALRSNRNQQFDFVLRVSRAVRVLAIQFYEFAFPLHLGATLKAAEVVNGHVRISFADADGVDQEVLAGSRNWRNRLQGCNFEIRVA